MDSVSTLSRESLPLTRDGLGDADGIAIGADAMREAAVLMVCEFAGLACGRGFFALGGIVVFRMGVHRPVASVLVALRHILNLIYEHIRTATWSSGGL